MTKCNDNSAQCRVVNAPIISQAIKKNKEECSFKCLTESKQIAWASLSSIFQKGKWNSCLVPNSTTNKTNNKEKQKVR